MPKSAPIFIDDIASYATPEGTVEVEIDKPESKSANRQPLAHGWAEDAVVQPGLLVGGGDYSVAQSYRVKSTSPQSFCLLVNLGATFISESVDRSIELPSGHFGMINFKEPFPENYLRAAGTRQWRSGIVMSQEWLDSGRLDDIEMDRPALRALLASHAAPKTAVTPDAVRWVAQQVIASMDAGGPLGRLRREIAGLQLVCQVADALFALPAPAGSGRRQLPPARIARVREFLDNLGPHDEVALSDLSKTANMSIRTLSRHFRSAYGTSIIAYVSEARMETARRALERGEMTIDQAAFAAGFTHRANFAKAFKRRFGVTPGAARVSSSGHV